MMCEASPVPLPLCLKLTNAAPPSSIAPFILVRAASQSILPPGCSVSSEGRLIGSGSIAASSASGTPADMLVRLPALVTCRKRSSMSSNCALSLYSLATRLTSASVMWSSPRSRWYLAPLVAGFI